MISPTLRATLEATEYLAGHSSTEDIAQLVELGLPVKEGWVTGTKTLDSLLLARMVEENGLKGAYELENLLLSFSNALPWKYETKAYDIKITVDERGKQHKTKDVDANRWPVDLRNRRCRLDAWASYVAVKHYYAKLKDSIPLVTFTHRIAALLGRVSLAGAVIDLDVFEKTAATLEGELAATRDQLTKAALAAGMESFSPTNDDHIRTLLFNHLGLPVLAKTAKSHEPSVDKDTLKQHDNETVRTLIAFNKADKQYGVNIVGLRALLSPCGHLGSVPVAWLPFRINPLGAKTGRRSSAHPNSQNWPPSVRSIVRSRWPNGTIADIDYRKLEAVLFGWVAKDEKLFTYFSEGRGYLDVAHELLGYDVKEGTPEYKATKSIVLGVHYNMQTPKMARGLRNLGILFSADYDEHERETDRLRHLYLKRFSGIARYMGEREDELLRDNSVRSLTGRVRHLLVPDGTRTPGYHRMLNQAINFPIQSLASDITGSAMLDAEEEVLRQTYPGGSEHPSRYVAFLERLVHDRRSFLTSSPIGGIMTPTIEHSLLINEVHDSLIVDLYPPTSKRDLEIYVESMRAVKSLRALVSGFTMPLNVDVKVGPAWGMKG